MISFPFLYSDDLHYTYNIKSYCISVKCQKKDWKKHKKVCKKVWKIRKNKVKITNVVKYYALRKNAIFCEFFLFLKFKSLSLPPLSTLHLSYFVQLCRNFLTTLQNLLQMALINIFSLSFVYHIHSTHPIVQLVAMEQLQYNLWQMLF